MHTDDVHFSAGSFAQAVPFGLIVDSSGEVTVVGRALARLTDQTFPVQADEFLEAKLPPRQSSALGALREGRQPLLLSVVGTQIRLRGEVVKLEEDGSLAFLASPVATSIEDVTTAGIQLQDFSAGDSTLDLLWSMQATHTALKDAEALSQRLRTAAAASDEAAAAKSRFLAIMSHEIRTPMNGLGSMVDLLRQTELTAEQLDLIRTIDDCASTLHTIVDDILDFSKLQDGAAQIESIPHRPADIADRVERIFQATADSTDVALGVEIAPGCRGWHLGDPVRIQQILSNLVSNAIKFSPNGVVVVTLDEVEGDGLRFRVRDTGIGIPKEARATLFDPFTQAEASTNRRFGGTGLGLSIAHSLAAAMGGDLALASSGPQGSTFELNLPMPKTDPPADRASTEVHPGPGAVRQDRPMNVLVVDDNPTNRLVADRLLRRLGVEPTLATDGSEAIDAVEDGEFDLILMDLMMPGITGIEATRAIRGLAVEWSDLPIVAFSAGVMEAEVQEAKDAGMGDFLAKPVRLRELEALLARYA